ncbi:MAG: DNA polymerase III subunit delta [Candidatus Glassbacteria bacterium GWA2_58_10]|uniref:DNA polymerase III subunit delta n=1 Tax=Candidatus Glassbacteria bacterium GWA2_58_10 TaxID=1817865 RepID=A0A1F5YE70_9BACT|nr:MAG: DNA polymerase III subunit delta [Candidatus Glassbacteria bacterium GWA2_58_10]
MVKLDLKRLIEQTAQGRLYPVYFFHGDESYLTRQAVETVAAAAVEKATADFNYERFHGAEISPERLLNSLLTPPMMAAHRVVLVRELEKAAPKVKEMLADYAEKPNSSTILILAAGERIRIDKRKNSPKWAASLEATAASAVFWPLRETELIQWIIASARQKGKTMSSRAAWDLYARIGGDLARLADDLEKLTLFCAGKSTIDEEDVRAMTGIDRGGSAFDWVDALAGRNPLDSCRIAGHLSSRGESAVGAIAAAAAHFNKVAGIREQLDAKTPAATIKKSLGLGYWNEEALQELFAQAGAYSVEKLDKALELLLETDLQLKTSSLPDRLLLETLAFRFAREKE